MSEALLEQLLDAPDLPELVDDARRVLAEEQRRRNKFYEEITPEDKWEFIQGEVVVHSPAMNRHLGATRRLSTLLTTFVQSKLLGEVFIEKAMTSFSRNDYEPDVMFFSSAKANLFDPDLVRFPVPDFICEVLSDSTKKRDRGIKFEDYALHGVDEYWIIDPVAETVETYQRKDKIYPPSDPVKDGRIASKVVAGFEIPVRALFDDAENLVALREIV